MRRLREFSTRIIQNVRISAQKKHILPASTIGAAADVVREAVGMMIGTTVPDDAPLMGAGLDSLGATELVSTLGHKFSSEIASTALFDHPTIRSLGNYLGQSSLVAGSVSETCYASIDRPADS